CVCLFHGALPPIRGTSPRGCDRTHTAGDSAVPRGRPGAISESNQILLRHACALRCLPDSDECHRRVSDLPCRCLEQAVGDLGHPSVAWWDSRCTLGPPYRTQAAIDVPEIYFAFVSHDTTVSFHIQPLGQHRRFVRVPAFSSSTAANRR